jgi:hypothetical protein
MSRQDKISLFEQAVAPKQYELDTIVKLLIWHMMFHPDTMKANDYVAQSLKMLCNALNVPEYADFVLDIGPSSGLFETKLSEVIANIMYSKIGNFADVLNKLTDTIETSGLSRVRNSSDIKFEAKLSNVYVKIIAKLQTIRTKLGKPSKVKKLLAEFISEIQATKSVKSMIIQDRLPEIADFLAGMSDDGTPYVPGLSVTPKMYPIWKKYQTEIGTAVDAMEPVEPDDAPAAAPAAAPVAAPVLPSAAEPVLPSAAAAKFQS